MSPQAKVAHRTFVDKGRVAIVQISGVWLIRVGRLAYSCLALARFVLDVKALVCEVKLGQPQCGPVQLLDVAALEGHDQ